MRDENRKPEPEEQEEPLRAEFTMKATSRFTGRVYPMLDTHAMLTEIAKLRNATARKAEPLYALGQLHNLLTLFSGSNMSDADYAVVESFLNFVGGAAASHGVSAPVLPAVSPELRQMLEEVRTWRSADWDDDAMAALDAASHLLRRAENALKREINLRSPIPAGADRKRLDWLQRVLTPDDPATEVFLAGLRSGDNDASGYQVEIAPAGDHKNWRSCRGDSLRSAIDVAMAEWRAEARTVPPGPPHVEPVNKVPGFA